jgi:intein-encoded DNA endonuclease-like protein
MPLYNVWYQNKTEPLEFSSASRVREEQIVGRIFAHEKIAHDASSTLSELISKNNLGPVRYTEDESEPFTIG